MNNKSFPNQYLHVRECQSDETWTVPIGEHDSLDLRQNLEQWVTTQFGGELEIDGEIMPKLDGDYYARVITDSRPPDSAVVWQSGGFYLKAVAAENLQDS